MENNMSRSRKAPATGKDSAKLYKQKAHRRRRRIEREAVAMGRPVPHDKHCGNPYYSPKDDYLWEPDRPEAYRK